NISRDRPHKRIRLTKFKKSNVRPASPSLPSPPASARAAPAGVNMSQLGKRGRNEAGTGDDSDDFSKDDERVDDFTTPRPTRTAITVASFPSVSSQSSSRQLTSTRSLTSSPRKQLRTAERALTGFVEQKFSLSRNALPLSLSALLGKLEAINTGLEHLYILIYAFTDRLLLTRYAEPSLITRLLNRATACDLGREGESLWNAEVYYLILSMVDFCITITLVTGSLENQTINALSDSRPGGSINYTDWGSFTQNPIALSIETKWLGFLPGILVFGHEWFFMANVPGPSGQSVLFTKQAIRTTEKGVRIYSILATVEVLRAWAADQFWPAFKEIILGLS
ncbi:hypothetical protein CI238_13277, partial [Colletotrichum incanum]